MADIENTSTDTDEAVPAADSAPNAEETTDVVASGGTEVPEGEEPAEETPAEPEAAAEPEPELPRFAAPFSSPEPTAVVARPRRRATRS
ncbi:MAG TPA: hypothetical protein VGD09_00140, partial [Blastococcus sp.]